MLPLALAISFALLSQVNALTGCTCNGLAISTTGFNNGQSYRIANSIDSSLVGEGYCMVDNVFTTTTTSKIDDGITRNVSTLYTDIDDVNIWCYDYLNLASPAACAQYVEAKKQGQMIENPDSLASCTYSSANFIPADCQCNFECTDGCVKCGTSSCINPDTQTCVSGVPQTVAQRRSFGQCPEGLTPCKLGSNAWECLDISNDLESCGGCPDEGGVDCSESIGPSQMTCHDGQCDVTRCLRGFSLLNNTCVPVFETAHQYCIDA
ncbi:hypothetical protein I317_02042 [Kwoniella heveanensis CBS 569]|uniref:Protein CPL1-like domain-containing protein n=1 Tax=Kwoniella heveanensis BCC8398 TaxID=1296120 RepID=A0A1B9GZ76_9TREE|nr:hypothetical protein I316_02180 [Kwoniella heveanensis BCC8398]OCF44089.1 hypothetical protein I317_02042 [Kwoniella heveanensis CBS 569]